jgi:hypothetical protein
VYLFNSFFSILKADRDARKLVLGFSGVDVFSVIQHNLPNSPSTTTSCTFPENRGSATILTFTFSGPIEAKLKIIIIKKIWAEKELTTPNKPLINKPPVHGLRKHE